MDENVFSSSVEDISVYIKENLIENKKCNCYWKCYAA